MGAQGVGHLPNGGVGFLEGLREDSHGLQFAAGSVVVGVVDHWVGLDPTWYGEFVETTLVLKGLLGPRADDDVQRLGEELVVCTLVPTVGVGVELNGGAGVDATGYAEVDAALGELVHEGHVFSNSEGVPVRKDDSALPET